MTRGRTTSSSGPTSLAEQINVVFESPPTAFSCSLRFRQRFLRQFLMGQSVQFSRARQFERRLRKWIAAGTRRMSIVSASALTLNFASSIRGEHAYTDIRNSHERVGAGRQSTVYPNAPAGAYCSPGFWRAGSIAPSTYREFHAAGGLRLGSVLPPTNHPCGLTNLYHGLHQRRRGPLQPAISAAGWTQAYQLPDRDSNLA